ncbi:MAG TPA: class I SAM-dependent methyltransferase [Acidimicrobiales bacterium]
MAYDKRGLKFGSVAEQYDEFRPGPPASAAELFGDISGRDVLEVAAGTGKWTRFLVELGAVVTAVEPDDDMRAVLVRRSPHVHAIQGAAEHLPLDDCSFDTVLVSSAWHWFEQPDATHEMARVLRDHGRLAVLWNGFSRDVPWIASLAELRERSNDEGKRPRGWSAEFSTDSPFEIECQVEIDWEWTRSVEEMISLFGTYSGAIIQSDDGREAMRAELRRRLDPISVNGVVIVPMTLRGTIATRRARR